MSLVADSGFPQDGGANPPGFAPTYDFARYSQKLHKTERIWIHMGMSLVPPPPIQLAKSYYFAIFSPKTA